MKTLISLFTLLYISFSSTSFDKCIIELTKEDLRADKIELQCNSFNDNKKFSIRGFSIKFPNHQAVIIEGSQLDLKTRSYIDDLKVGEMVSIFDIKSAYDGDQLITMNDIPSFYIKIIEKENAAVIN